MRAALRSNWHAAALVVAILLPLILPAMLPTRAQPSRRELYSAAGWTLGPYPWLEQQAFDERQPIDLLFAGSSHIWSATDNPALQRALAQSRPGEAVVRTLGWPRSGYDILYFIVKDVLARRAVKTLVICDEVSEDKVQAAAHRWYRYADEPSALNGISLHDAAALYAASVLGMPRNLLSLVRPNLGVDLAPLSKTIWQSHYRADSFESRLGALSAHIAYDYDPAFEEFEPPASAARAEVYSASTSAHFSFKQTALPPYKRAFLERLASLAKVHDTTLVFLDIPTFNERRNTVSSDRLFWPVELPGRIRVVGLPPAALFAGLSDSEVRRLYYDEGHLNFNGQRFFSAAIADALVQVANE